MDRSSTLVRDLASLAGGMPLPGWAPGRPGARQRYAGALVAMHGIVRASVPLMQAALDRCSGRGDAPLAQYLSDQIVAEAGHDDWIVEDACGLGEPASRFDERPSDRVTALVGSQYYWILHHDKTALLGYILTLETSAGSEAGAREAARRSGLPLSSFKTIIRHAADDPDHVRHLCSTIDALGLRESQWRLVLDNAMFTAVQLRLILAESNAAVFDA